MKKQTFKIYTERGDIYVGQFRCKTEARLLATKVLKTPILNIYQTTGDNRDYDHRPVTYFDNEQDADALWIESIGGNALLA